jgi:dTDP-4-dehydrorhamnose 3,5-epimerase
MIFSETAIPGAFIVHPEAHVDERGFFARTWCQREFAARGLSARLVQCSLSLTRARGTLRGMHYQAAPREEAKLIRCAAGAIYDVIVDLRSGSPARYRWWSTELTATERVLLYVPEGVAHGYQTLTDGVEVEYQITEAYAPECARGFRFDDPAIGIRWPLPVGCVSPRDLAWPPLEPAAGTPSPGPGDAVPAGRARREPQLGLFAGSGR